MVNIQYGHIGVRSNEEEDDLDECKVIGVFEKREEAVVEREGYLHSHYCGKIDLP